jgi:ATP-binding cassette subfamily C (CFTR/MRP) protein 4
VYKYYASIVLEVWDLESRCKSPIYSNYGETVDGLSVIRAYGFADAFLRKNMFLNDRVSNTGIAGRDLQMWYSFCLTTLGTIAFFVVGTMLLLNPLPQGQMGYVLSLILGLSVGFDWMFECLSNVELAMGAFGRLNHYISEVPQEQYAVDPFSRVSDDLRLKSSELGNSVVIKKLQLQYNPEDRPVLNDVSLTINKAEKIGICGRTGAGKSSIINALLRMAPITQGEVFVNDLPASQMELTKLRSQIAIIPQDPVLFSGTIRSNLDPFNDYEDHQLWMALDKVCLKDVITALPNQLDAEISENGSNFSVGQRQLICLARAVLRKIRNSSLILLMDEATANVDPKTDSLIQQTIQEEFESCTVLTIAHRINTIMHCNRILVMEKGHVAEYDSPQVLLANPQSHFAQLVRQSTANLLATSAE